MPQLKKLSNIEDKIQKLQDERERIKLKRSADITKIIHRINIDHIDDSILVGALLYLKDKIETDQKLEEEWLAAGRKFLRRKQPAKTKNNSQKAA